MARPCLPPTPFRDEISAMSAYLELVSGRRTGWLPALQRAGLGLLEPAYGLAVALRNAAFDAGWQALHRVEAPVLSVGNLTVGGTGKTPCVQWLARWFRQQHARVAVLSRGYGAASGPNDEALQLEKNLPDVPHLENPDRYAAARLALDELEMQVLLLDDGFQHRRLFRDFDLVLLDALQPFGYGHLLPRGTLREPLAGLRRAHAVALTRADQVDASERARLRTIVAKYTRKCVWLEARHAPQALVAADGRREPLANLSGRPVAAFCGLGHPAAFRRTLEQLGDPLVGWREFPDHHPYPRETVLDLQRWADALPAETLVVCTEKDLVKLELDQLGPCPLRALAIELEWLTGQDALETELLRFVPAIEDSLPAEE